MKFCQQSWLKFFVITMNYMQLRTRTDMCFHGCSGGKFMRIPPPPLSVVYPPVFQMMLLNLSRVNVNRLRSQPPAVSSMLVDFSLKEQVQNATRL